MKAGFVILNMLLVSALAGLSATARAEADIYDVEVEAMWDSIRLIGTAGGIYQSRQDFESGYHDGQRVGGWIPVGDGNAMRVGFGNSMDDIQWGAYIAGTGGPATAFHPSDTVRGYTVAGNYFISDGNPNIGSHYFFIEMQNPITWMMFASYDYASGTWNESFELSTYLGRSFADAVEVQPVGRVSAPVAAGLPSGSVDFYSRGAVSPWAPSFNLLAFKMSTPDAGVAFDNFMVRTAPIPEPENALLLAAGLAAMYLRRRKAA